MREFLRDNLSTQLRRSVYSCVNPTVLGRYRRIYHGFEEKYPFILFDFGFILVNGAPLRERLSFARKNDEPPAVCHRVENKRFAASIFVRNVVRGVLKATLSERPSLFRGACDESEVNFSMRMFPYSNVILQQYCNIIVILLQYYMLRGVATDHRVCRGSADIFNIKYLLFI